MSHTTTPTTEAARLILQRFKHDSVLAVIPASFLRTHIFDLIPISDGADAKFPLDFFDQARSAAVFVASGEHSEPNQIVHGDEVLVPSFTVQERVEWDKDYTRDDRVDVVIRSMELLQEGLQAKIAMIQLRLIVASALSHRPAFQEITQIHSVEDLMKSIPENQNGTLTHVLYDNSLPDTLICGLDTRLSGDRKAKLLPVEGLFEFISNGFIALDLDHRDSFVGIHKNDVQVVTNSNTKANKHGVVGIFNYGAASLDSRRALAFTLK